MSNSTDHDDLPPAVAHVLNTKHGVTPADVAELSQEEVALLRRIAAGERDVGDGDRTKAMAALVERGDGDTAALLVEVATDASESVDLRAMATARLSALSPAEAEPALIDLLNAEPSQVVAAAAKALGKIGGPDAFEALSQRSPDPDESGTVGRPSTFPDAVSREVAFAHTLVGYRLGRDRPKLPVIPGEDRSELAGRDSAVAIPVEPVTDVEGILAKTTGTLYGISPYREWAARFGLGEEGLASSLLVLNGDYATGTVPDLVERPGIYGLLLSGRPETGQYVVSSLLLVTPDDGELQVAQLRTDGTTLFAGTGRLEDDGVRLTLTDTGRPGTPPTRYVVRRARDDPRLEFEESTVAVADTETRTPSPLEQ